MEMKWISIAVAALAAVILGYVWHNFIFKDTDENASKNKLSPPVFMLVSYILNLLIAYGLHRQVVGLHQFIRSLRASAGENVSNPFLHGVFHGAMDSLVYGAISVLIITALLDGKGLKAILSRVLYWLITISLMGGIVGMLG
ncbi:MAG: Unknown protein [uncultured Aureispira sp.]|uniref:Uncharacterized protein n=1 Tax=uncultured Aureispira sp. TaxID=1331704 RepID=A0A6S6SUK5_9BACT|nr:MAG: Unknown protein [uncultured Aureispira sp.]